MENGLKTLRTFFRFKRVAAVNRHAKAARVFAAALPTTLVSTAALFLSFWLPVLSFAAEVVDRIVAVVNNEVISLYELNQAAQPLFEQVKSSQYPEETERQLLYDLRSKVLNELINQKLADQELKRQNISVSDKEVDNAIERLKESRFLTDEDLRSALSAQGLTLEEYREETKKQILRAKLVNREVRSKIVITEADIEDYYAQHKEEFAGEKKYHLRNIYVRLDALHTDADRQRAKAIMENIKKDLEAGKTFDAVLEEHSGATAPVEGGDLGSFKLDDLSSQLKDTIGAMQPGEFTPIIEMPLGYQIVYVTKITNTIGKDVAAASAEIQQKLYNQIVDQKYQSWLQALRERSHIKIIN